MAEYSEYGVIDNESSKDCPKETVLISVEDFYDLLMEQQEQM